MSYQMPTDRTAFLSALLKEYYPHNPSCITGNSFDLPTVLPELHLKMEISEARLTITIDKGLQEGTAETVWKTFIKECIALSKQLNSQSFRFVDGLNGSSVEPNISNLVELSSPLLNIYDDKALRTQAYNLLQTVEALTVTCEEVVFESEGNDYTSLVKRYERSVRLRSRAIEIHGLNCAVCEFNFEEKYGVIGKEFIHIHHLERLADKGQRFVDSKKDLVPVCPNCHAMLHKKTPPYLPEELKFIINKA